MFAVVRTGGKQYRVQEGRTIRVGKLAGEPGETVELGDVLMMGDGADVTIGSPSISGARVVGTIAEQGREKKIVVFRYKSKTRQRKKTGHRQHFTSVRIEDILAPGQSPKPKKERKAPEPVAEEKPKRGRGRKPAAAVAETPAEAEVTAEAPETVAPDEAPEAAAPAEAEAAAETTEAPDEAPADEAAAEKPKRTRKKAE
ncbi:MAG TPA: 50S ribosomal protein L21 [Dehalococcoidia bacterium]|nr:50S ribosomal protein L21 [Dehalococcoidia bacterium]